MVCRCFLMFSQDLPLLSFSSFGLKTSPGRYSRYKRLKPFAANASICSINTCLPAMESGTAPIIRFLLPAKASLSISCAKEVLASTGGTAAGGGSGSRKVKKFRASVVRRSTCCT
ncbi:hypothetical protein D3C85_1583400 [compost metagenome]